MVVRGLIIFQIGRNGVTEGTLESLTLSFKKHKSVRISVLRSAVRDKKRVKEMAEEISDKLVGNYKYTIIGFTIVMRKAGGSQKRNKSSKK